MFDKLTMTALGQLVAGTSSADSFDTKPSEMPGEGPKTTHAQRYAGHPLTSGYLHVSDSSARQRGICRILKERPIFSLSLGKDERDDICIPTAERSLALAFCNYGGAADLSPLKQFRESRFPIVDDPTSVKCDNLFETGLAFVLGGETFMIRWEPGHPDLSPPPSETDVRNLIAKRVALALRYQFLDCVRIENPYLFLVDTDGRLGPMPRSSRGEKTLPLAVNLETGEVITPPLGAAHLPKNWVLMNFEFNQDAGVVQLSAESLKNLWENHRASLVRLFGTQNDMMKLFQDPGTFTDDEVRGFNAAILQSQLMHQDSLTVMTTFWDKFLWGDNYLITGNIKFDQHGLVVGLSRERLPMHSPRGRIRHSEIPEEAQVAFTSIPYTFIEEEGLLWLHNIPAQLTPGQRCSLRDLCWDKRQAKLDFAKSYPEGVEVLMGTRLGNIIQKFILTLGHPDPIFTHLFLLQDQNDQNDFIFGYDPKEYASFAREEVNKSMKIPGEHTSKDQNGWIKRLEANNPMNPSSSSNHLYVVIARLDFTWGDWVVADETRHYPQVRAVALSDVKADFLHRNEVTRAVAFINTCFDQHWTEHQPDHMAR